MWPQTVRGADGDDVLRVSGIGDRAKDEVPEPNLLLVPASIASGGDYDHAGGDQSVAGDADWGRTAAVVAHIVGNREADVDAVHDRSVGASSCIHELYELERRE